MTQEAEVLTNNNGCNNAELTIVPFIPLHAQFSQLYFSLPIFPEYGNYTLFCVLRKNSFQSTFYLQLIKNFEYKLAVKINHCDTEAKLFQYSCLSICLNMAWHIQNFLPFHISVNSYFLFWKMKLHAPTFISVLSRFTKWLPTYFWKYLCKETSVTYSGWYWLFKNINNLNQKIGLYYTIFILRNLL